MCQSTRALQDIQAIIQDDTEMLQPCERMLSNIFSFSVVYFFLHIYFCIEFFIMFPLHFPFFLPYLLHILPHAFLLHYAKEHMEEIKTEITVCHIL